MRHSMTSLALITVFCSFIISCSEIPNSPYRLENLRKPYFYSSYDTPPKTLDPAVSYSSNEAAIIGSMYEPPFMYHPFKRPYILVPNSVREIPQPEYSKQVTVYAEARSVQINKILTNKQKRALNEFKPVLVDYLSKNLNADEIEKVNEKLVSKQLMKMQENAVKQIEELGYETTYMRKQIQFIYEKIRKFAQNTIKQNEKLSEAQFQTTVNEVYAEAANNKVYKASVDKAQLLANIKDEAKEYWTRNSWNPNEIISVEGNVIRTEARQKTTKVESVVKKQLNNVETVFVAIDANVEIPEGSILYSITESFELITLSEFKNKDELKKIGLVDNKFKYLTISNRNPLNANLANSLKVEDIEENNKGTLNFKNNSITIFTGGQYKIDFDSIDENGSVFSLAHFSEQEKLGNSEKFIVTFNIWLPSFEAECRDIHKDIKIYANKLSIYDMQLLRANKYSVSMPYYINTGNIHAIYTMRIMPRIFYQPHPCFSRDSKTGSFLFHEGKKPFISSITNDDGSIVYYIFQNGQRVEISKELKENLEGQPIDVENLSNVFDLDDFAKYFPEYDPEQSTRELTAADYVYQLKRMHNPQAPAQILMNLLFPYIENTIPYYKNLRSRIIAERKQRRAEQGISYSQEVDEEENPIKLNYELDAFDGAKVVDKYTYQIILTQPYPQFKYWMAMPFFAPIPWEADMFFLQGAMQKNTLTLSKFPVATGAYRMWKYKRQSEISSIKNENFNRIGPDNGKKPPLYIETERGSNLLIASMPKGVSNDYKTLGTGVDKNANGKLDGSLDVRDYLVKHNFEELPFFDENGNGIYDGIRYWNEEERFARFNYAENYIDFNGNNVFDEGDRRVNFAEGIYFEDLNLNGKIDSTLDERWYEFPATYRTVYPYAGEDHSCPKEHIDKLLTMQAEVQQLWVEKDKNQNRINELDKKILDEFIKVIEEYNYNQDELGDKAAGNLRDSGRRLPFLEAIIRRRDKEPTSIWSKFMQGYYELSGIGEDKFDKVVSMSTSGAYLSEELKSKGVKLNTTIATTIGYTAFNMQNQTWGWAENFDDEQPDLKKAMLRQAVAIALNFEEFNDTFSNGRNVPSHMAVPPGIFGYESPAKQTFIEKIADLEYFFNEKILKDENDKRKFVSEMTPEELADWGERYSIIFQKFSELNKFEKEDAINQKYAQNKKEYLKKGIKIEDLKFDADDMIAEVHFGLNWVVYKWNKETNSPERRSISYAKKLLEQAGYPNGKDKTGNQLSLTFLSMGTGPIYIDINTWRKRKLGEIGINYEVNTVDYNKFQEIAKSGGYQCLSWGWNADYPDPENFFFLLQGKALKSASNYLRKMSQGGGENAANYWSEDYDKLFKQMSTMSDSPARLKIIRKMNQLLRRDMPWLFDNLRVSYVLYHHWYKNSKTNLMGNNTYWFRRIEPDVRAEYRIENNQPKWMPVIIFFALLILAFIPGVIAKARRETKKTGRIDVS